MRLHNFKDLCLVISVQLEEDLKTWGWRKLPVTAQQNILVASASNMLTVPTNLLRFIHTFLNESNPSTLQADCNLTYAGHNLYLTISLGWSLIQGPILMIPDTASLTGMSPILTPPELVGPENEQHRTMKINFFSIIKDRLSKEEARKIFVNASTL